MPSITAKKLREFLNIVPDNTPVYIVGMNDEDGIIDKVSIDSVYENDFKSFVIRLDYRV